jgi:hypothetical protein
MKRRARLAASRRNARSAARRQHDCGTVRLETLGDREAVEVRKLNSEQENVRPQLCRRPDRARAVNGLAHDREACGLEQRARCGAEACVIVHDHHRAPHAKTVADAGARAIRARTEVGLNVVPAGATLAERCSLVSRTSVAEARLAGSLFAASWK